LTHLDDAATASERAAELARLRYAEGASDFLQVLDAERTMLEAQDRLALGRTDATTGLVALYRALGGRWPEPGAR
jgi:outer membrane protein TolC